VTGHSPGNTDDVGFLACGRGIGEAGTKAKAPQLQPDLLGGETGQRETHQVGGHPETDSKAPSKAAVLSLAAVYFDTLQG